MANFFGKFESKKQEWATPQDLFDQLNEEFKFTLDLAASPEDAKCPNYYTKEIDGLAQDWNGMCWLNPPYGSKEYKLENWIKKAYHSTQSNNECIVVMLIPARTNTRWWHNYCMNAAEVKFICGRPKFGNAKHGLPQPLAIIVFKQHDGNTKFSSLRM